MNHYLKIFFSTCMFLAQLPVCGATIARPYEEIFEEETFDFSGKNSNELKAEYQALEDGYNAVKDDPVQRAAYKNRNKNKALALKDALQKTLMVIRNQVLYQELTDVIDKIDTFLLS